MKHVLLDWTFDGEAFGLAVAQADEAIGGTLHEFMAVSSSTIRRWRVSDYSDGFDYPSMTNFIRLCNLIDADVRSFFILEDKAASNAE